MATMDLFETFPVTRRVDRPGDGSKLLVVGFDDSAAGRAALAYAAGLARREDAQLVAVLVERPNGLLAIGPMMAAAAARAAAHEARAALVIEVDARLTELGVRHEVVVRDGDFAAALDEVATRSAADAVIVGRPRQRRGRGALRRLLRRASQPVIAVPWCPPSPA